MRTYAKLFTAGTGFCRKDKSFGRHAPGLDARPCGGGRKKTGPA
ncbi:hypothetical protein [Candidatus Tokpelaia sp.]|nr:hypothetical protein [Candidatus Tokpelaia sp.]